MRLSIRTRGRQFTACSDYWPAGDQAIDDHDYRDHEENVDQTATHVDDEESKDPQDEQNHRDSPKHFDILGKGFGRASAGSSPAWQLSYRNSRR